MENSNKDFNEKRFAQTLVTKRILPVLGSLSLVKADGFSHVHPLVSTVTFGAVIRFGRLVRFGALDLNKLVPAHGGHTLCCYC